MKRRNLLLTEFSRYTSSDNFQTNLDANLQMPKKHTLTHSQYTTIYTNTYVLTLLLYLFSFFFATAFFINLLFLLCCGLVCSSSFCRLLCFLFFQYLQFFASTFHFSPYLLFFSLPFFWCFLLSFREIVIAVVEIFIEQLSIQRRKQQKRPEKRNPMSIFQLPREKKADAVKFQIKSNKIHTKIVEEDQMRL